MERFFSPGYKVRPPGPPGPTSRVGRPRREVPEGALDLGERQLRTCASKKNLRDEHRFAALERQVECLRALCSEEVAQDERLQKVLQLVEHADEDLIIIINII